MVLIPDNKQLPEIFDRMIGNFYRPGSIAVIGLTGRAGAGKTTFAGEFVDYCASNGIEVVQYHGDWDFRLSSKERKLWIEEPRMRGDLAEYVKRADQALWWNFNAMNDHLSMLRTGQPIQLTAAYDKASGEKTLSEVITPPGEQGGIILLENAFIGNVLRQLDGVTFLYADPATAFARTLLRDGHRKGFYDLVQRVAETTMSEDAHWQTYLPTMMDLADRFVAIDNTDLSAPAIMPQDQYSRLLITTPFTFLLVPVQHLHRNGNGTYSPQEALR